MRTATQASSLFVATTERFLLTLTLQVLLSLCESRVTILLRAIHMAIDDVPKWLDWKLHKDIEKVDRLTGPAKAFAFTYVRESSVDENGVQWGDYGLCWPEDLEFNKRLLVESEDPAIGEVAFVPLWYIPRELKDENKNEFRAES